MSKPNRWYDSTKSHHTPTGFTNPDISQRDPGALKRWREERKAQGLPRPPGEGYEAFVRQWWQKADFSGDEDAVWWLGHACLLLRVGGQHILCDPALGKRASPLPFAGPLRKTPLAATIAELPNIDWVLYSHNHYDHLDRGTLRRLLKRFPALRVAAPLGMGAWLRRHGVKHVAECDWWDALTAPAFALHCTPARHWSMRSLWDRNRSLWCGWVVSTSRWRFFFSGDSGYTPRLAEIGQRLGPFDAAALPIGAYAPEWFMAGSHMSPTEAVRFYQELHQPRVIPIHWGVFELADESLDEPPRELLRAQREAGVNNADFAALKIGGKITL